MQDSAPFSIFPSDEDDSFIWSQSYHRLEETGRRMSRQQQTISQISQLSGYALFTNAAVEVSFHPAEANQGILFRRSDLPGSPLIPASVEHIAPEERRTKLATEEASVEMIEHVMAALAGLQIDNCIVDVNGPELPGCDGSSLQYVEAILAAGPVTQTAIKQTVVINSEETIELDTGNISIGPDESGLRLHYDLDYGSGSPIPPQQAEFVMTPEVFVAKVASARTFVLESEIEYLRSRGYGKHVTYQDLVVYGTNGPVENELRAHNECARHKLLDCLGDLSLCGYDVQGTIRASRSGHRHNHELARRLHQLAKENHTEDRDAA